MMIPQITRILYATDLSDSASHSLRYAASISRKFGGKITILHVLEMSGEYTFDLSAYLSEEKWAEIRKSHEQEALGVIHERLDRYRKQAAAEDESFTVEIEDIVIAKGNPVEEIVQHAETGKYDMICMASHGHGSLTDTLMGTTVRRVMRRTGTPVLVVRLPEVAAE